MNNNNGPIITGKLHLNGISADSSWSKHTSPWQLNEILDEILVKLSPKIHCRLLGAVFSPWPHSPVVRGMLPFSLSVWIQPEDAGIIPQPKDAPLGIGEGVTLS